jgi:hypothetical protein
MRRTLITLGLLLAVGSPCAADDWASAMFDNTSHDFGSVARGQKVEYRFTLQNKYLEDVCIESVTSSCHCITGKASQARLKTYEEGAIIATADTSRFLGRKQATFRVKLTCVVRGERLSSEVLLHAYAYIRSDVVIEPGIVRFGSVPFGTDVPAKKVSVSYAGRSDWEIVKAECDNPHLDVKLVETGRQAGQVSYDLFVGLKAGAPVGLLRDQVMLVTNDRDENATRVMVSVEGEVTSTVTATPASLMLGLVNPGQRVERTIVVRGKEPFHIAEVSGPNDQFQFQFSDEAKTLHVVSVTFTAGDAPGSVSGEIRIRTDAPGSEAATVTFHGGVVAPTGSKPSPPDAAPASE